MTTINQSYIYINNIRLHASHGVLPQERVTGGDYSIDTKIGYDISQAMLSDNVTDTLNYAEVFNIIKEEMAQNSNLLEHVAGRIANRLIREYAQISTIMLRITKCNPPMGANCDGAGIEIHLTNEKTK